MQNATQTVEEEKPKPPTVQEIKQKIEKYNAKVTNCLLMKLVRAGLVSPHTHRLLLVSVGSAWGQTVGKVSLGGRVALKLLFLLLSFPESLQVTLPCLLPFLWH